MNCSLNFDSSDPKFILLKKVLDFMNSKRSLNALTRVGFQTEEQCYFTLKSCL